MKQKTVNQLLELLYDKHSPEEINDNSQLRKIKAKLFEIKLKTINGGKVKVENSDEISRYLASL